MQVIKDYKEDSKQGAHGGSKTEVSEDANSTHFWKTFKADAQEDSSQKPAKVAMKNGKLMNIPQDAVEDMMSKMVLTKIKNDFIEDKKQVESQSQNKLSNGTTPTSESSAVSHLSTGNEKQEQHEKEVLAQQLAQKEIVKRKMSLALEHLSSQVSQNNYNSNSLGPKSPFSSLMAPSNSQGHLVHHHEAKN